MRILAALLTVFLLCGVDLQAAEDRPNVIVIFTDDMGYADVGCYGGTFAPTPNIDQLAREGTRFTRFYVASPICSPSRTALLTGMYPSRWRIKTFLQSRAGNRAAGQNDYLNPKAPSMARAFQQAGYATAHIGKWHLGGGRDVTNAPKFAEYGYDEHVSTYESPQPDPDLTSSNWIWSPEDKVKRWNRTAYFVDKTLDFLSRKKGQPCFINFWPDDVHNPWIAEGSNPKEGKRENRNREEFKKVLAEYDRQIGRLMAGLKQQGLDKNTIVIFTSDNGPGPDFPGNPRSLGLRGQKGTLYEGGIRVPFIVRWPEKTPANRVDEKSLFNAVDLLPTLCKLTGVPGPAGATLDGEDMSALFLGRSVERKQPMFWEFGRGKNGTDDTGKGSPNLAIREDKWKLLVNGDGSQPELYNLDSDPKEKSNVATAHPEETKRLTAAVLKWKSTLPAK